MDWDIPVPLVALKGQHFSTRTLQFQQNLGSEWTSVFSNLEVVSQKMTAHMKESVLCDLYSPSFSQSTQYAELEILPEQEKKEAETSFFTLIYPGQKCWHTTLQTTAEGLLWQRQSTAESNRKKDASEPHFAAIPTISNHRD